MKKTILTLVTFFFLINSSLAMNPADFLNKMPDNFSPECYEYYNKIDKSEVRNNKNEKYKTYKINIEKTNDLVVTQFGFILPYKFYNSSNSFLDYSNNLDLDNKYLNDSNFNTYKEINSINKNELILNLKNSTIKNNFSFTFNYESNNYIPTYYISNDNINWNILKKEDIENFSFKYFKIIFEPKNNEEFLENIKIYELNFTEKSKSILVKSFYNDNIEIYSKYNCKTKDFNTSSKNYNSLSIDKNTKIINIISEKNPKYNTFNKKDYDNDWVPDETDNCKYRYNPNQSDIDWNWIWDMCSDDDKDWIIWYYDNCINISNSDQKDINRNNVWDKCEFDKDSDWIYDSIDNCINTPNNEQLDSDRDNIWDKCDNSIYYNPRQLDINQNWIWDITEEKEKKLKENDKDSDWIINFNDNCKDISNKDQLDSDSDWIWNKCDNCVDFQNTNQFDYNKNWIWDICEDSDSDWIDWITDNCINISNSDQKDTDNNWVWDVCEDSDNDNIVFQLDNCPYDYNPDQNDVDQDKIWDKCDKDDNRFIESNKVLFIIILSLIIVVFWVAIFKMIKKIK